MKNSAVVISNHFFGFPAPQITVSVSNNTQELALPLKDTITLTCSVSFPESLLGNVSSIQWKHKGSAVINESSSTFTILLSLLSDAGVYICNASVSSPYLDLAPAYETASTGVTIQGYFKQMQKVYNI